MPILDEDETIAEAVEACPGFDPLASGWVYTLTVRSLMDAKLWWYVGTTEARNNRSDRWRLVKDVRRGQPLKSRIKHHGRADGSFIYPPGERGFEVIALDSVISIYADRRLGAKLREAERTRFLRTAIEKDTTRVLGGK